MHNKNKGTKSFTELRKYLLNGFFFWQYYQELYLEPNQKSMVDLFAKIVNDFWLLTFSAKNPHHKC